LEWHYASPATVPAMTECFNDVVQRVVSKSNQRLVMKVFYKGSTPYSAADSLYAVSEGNADLVRIYFMHITGMSDLFEFTTIPGLVGSVGENQALVENIVLPYMRELLDKEYNTEILAMNGQHPWMVALKKKITSAEDFKGLKLPVRTAVQMDFWERLGGIPVTVPFSELMTSLKTGLVDGAATNADNLLKLGFYEETPYFYNITMAAAIHTVLINKDSMAKLPEDLQALIREEFAKGQAEYHEYNMRRDAEHATEIKAKANLVELPDEVKQVIEEKTMETAQAWLSDRSRSARAKEFFDMILAAKK